MEENVRLKESPIDTPIILIKTITTNNSIIVNPLFFIATPILYYTTFKSHPPLTALFRSLTGPKTCSEWIKWQLTIISHFVLKMYVQ